MVKLSPEPMTCCFTLWTLSHWLLTFNETSLIYLELLIVAFFLLTFSSVISWCVTNWFKWKCAEIFSQQEGNKTWLLVLNLRFVSRVRADFMGQIFRWFKLSHGPSLRSLPGRALCGGWSPSLPSPGDKLCSCHLLPPCSLGQASGAGDTALVPSVFRQRSALQACKLVIKSDFSFLK